MNRIVCVPVGNWDFGLAFIHSWPPRRELYLRRCLRCISLAHISFSLSRLDPCLVSFASVECHLIYWPSIPSIPSFSLVFSCPPSQLGRSFSLFDSSLSAHNFRHHLAYLDRIGASLRRRWWWWWWLANLKVYERE